MTAMQQALRLLARRAYAEQELRQRLLRGGGLNHNDVDQAIAKCYDLGYLDDQHFAQERIRHRFDQGYGPAYLRAELRQCGVAEEIVTQALQQQLEQSPAVVVARAVWQRRPDVRDPMSGQSLRREDARKHYTFLRRRGFDHDTVCQVLQTNSDRDDFEGIDHECE
ncbi:MAG: regulatory protein RecX [Magnetococcales bacterium]|nr:regulatory protein RecX [Magnetococcales bacterium]